MTQVNTQDGLAVAIQLVARGRTHELSPAMERQVQRLQFVADEYARGLSRKEITDALIDDWGIGPAQAYQDYALAKKYFLKENLIELRDVHVSILLDTALEAIAVERKKASPDAKGLAALLKVYADAIKAFTGDKEAIDWEKVVLPQFVLVFDPRLIGSTISADVEEFASIRKKYEKQIMNWKKTREIPETPYEDVESDY
jgi:hypothetical protein